MINNNDTVKTRIVIPSLLWIPISLALIARFYVIQIQKHEYYQTAADRSCTAQRKLEGRWGEICDRDGYMLVGNRPCVRISCSPHELKPEKRRIAAELLNRHLGRSFDHYYQKLSPTRRSAKAPDKTVPNKYQMLGREVPLDVAHRLRDDLQKNKVPLTLLREAVVKPGSSDWNGIDEAYNRDIVRMLFDGIRFGQTMKQFYAETKFDAASAQGGTEFVAANGNTDAEAVLVPTHTVRSEDEFEDILSVSDSAIPVILVRKRAAVFIGENMEYLKAIRRVFSTGFATVAVFDLDDSLTEENWAYLMDEGDVIPCSFTGRIKGERFEELGFGRCFTAPQ